MYFDKSLMFLDSEAHSATPAVVNMNHAGADKGEPLKIQVSAVGATGVTAIVIKTGATDATATTTIATIPMTAAQANSGFSFHLPPGCQEYVTFSLTGATAGTFTSGIVLDSQTAE